MPAVRPNGDVSTDGDCSWGSSNRSGGGVRRVAEGPADGPDDAPERVETIHRRYLDADPPPPGEPWSPAYHLRMLTLHLLETWGRIGADTQPTNNTAERRIGLLLKMRSKTMRGFAQPGDILRFVHLMAHLREAGRPPRTRAVIKPVGGRGRARIKKHHMIFGTLTAHRRS